MFFFMAQNKVRLIASAHRSATAHSGGEKYYVEMRTVQCIAESFL